MTDPSRIQVGRGDSMRRGMGLIMGDGVYPYHEGHGLFVDMNVDPFRPFYASRIMRTQFPPFLHGVRAFHRFTLPDIPSLSRCET